MMMCAYRLPIIQFFFSLTLITQYINGFSYRGPIQRIRDHSLIIEKSIKANTVQLRSTNGQLVYRRQTIRQALLLDVDISTIDSSSLVISSITDSLMSNDNIKQAFKIATFGPQYLWLLMILIPNSKVTKTIMGGYSGIVAFSLLHLFIVIVSASQENGTAPIQEFSGVFDPSPTADPQAAMVGMMRYPNFVTEEWSHVLTWDLFVGRWIWLDGLKRGIFTPHSVLLCNLIGPPGFLLHLVTCLLSGKGLPGNEAPAVSADEGENAD